MTAWEYLFLEIDGHNRNFEAAENMLVTTSDQRWQATRMPKNIVGVVNQLGAEGWEMVNSSSEAFSMPTVIPKSVFHAVFKRPRP